MVASEISSPYKPNHRDSSSEQQHHQSQRRLSHLNENQMKYQPLVIRYSKQDGTPGECPLGCGNSLQDLIFIILFYIGFFAFLAGFFVLLLMGAIATDNSHTLLWTFFVLGVLFAIFVSGAVRMGMQQVDLDKKNQTHFKQIMEHCSV